uniref:PX domain-containing protein n=1 Tax=Parastrongyloides trichosuri TaxID=131310 RepID=A0A0N5A6Z9_PARTI
MNTYRNRIFSVGSNNLYLSVTNSNYITNAVILCSYNGLRPMPLNKVEVSIINELEKGCNFMTYLGVVINHDTRKWSEVNKVLLGQRYSQFVQFLLSVLPRGKSVKLKIAKEYEKDNNFLIYILTKVRSKRVESIELYSLYDILWYSKFIDITRYKVRRQTPYLRTFRLDIESMEKFSNLPNFDKLLKKFLDCFKELKYFSLELCSTDPTNGMKIAFKILGYAEVIDIDVTPDILSRWIGMDNKPCVIFHIYE